MPRVIDAWNGSAQTSALSDTAYRAYDNLLMAAWQSEDGMLPVDDAALAMASRVNGRWPRVRDEVLRMFKRDGERLFNPRLLKEWNRAHEVYKRKASGGGDKSKGQQNLPFLEGADSAPYTATATTTKAKTARPREYSKNPNPTVGMHVAVTPEAVLTDQRREQMAYWRAARDKNSPVWKTAELWIVRALDAEDVAMRNLSQNSSTGVAAGV